MRRSDQRRLSLLIVGFGVIMVCFSVARRPEFWSRLFPESDVESDVSVQKGDGSTSARPVTADPGLNYDEFIVSGDEQMNPEAVSVSARRIPYQDLVEAPESVDSNSIPVVPDNLLQTIKDDVIGVHSSESDAYFATMLMAVKYAEDKRFNPPEEGAYALFMDSPNSSRGMAWRITGKLRRLSLVKGRVNSFGARMVYDAWLSADDSGDQLVHAVAMKVDPSIARFINSDTPDQTFEFDRKNSPEVQFSGYFFKREGYPSRKGVSLAPLFLVGRLREIPLVVATDTRAEQLTPYLGWLVVAVCGSVLLMVWSFAASDAAHAQTRARQLTKLPAVASFDDVQAVSVQDALHQLEESHVRPDSRVDHQS